MPLFGIFLMALVLLVYRSWRALAAIVLTLGAVVAMAVGLADAVRLVEQRGLDPGPAHGDGDHHRDPGLPPFAVHGAGDAIDRAPHHARALANKFLPCTASMFATAVGFAALAVSDIRPVREMGLWTACGLIVAWFSCFTLFPALQSLLRMPDALRGGERRPALRRLRRRCWCPPPAATAGRWWPARSS